MKTLKPTISVKAVALAGAFSIAAATSQAQFTPLPPNTGDTGVPMLPANTPGALSGTVLSVIDSPFADNALPTPFASGILRSFVVDRDPTAAVALDFVYQLVNTSAPPPDLTTEFFRLKTTGGFQGLTTISVANTNAFVGLIAGTGSGFVPGSYTMGGSLEDAASADRDVGTFGSVGFSFPTQPPPAFIGDPRNVGFGESSSFLIVRTDAASFGTVRTAVSGAATGFATAFAPIPEPGTVGFGLAMFGVCASRFLKRRKMPVEA